MSSGSGYKHRGFAVKPQSTASIRRIANQVRMLMDLGDGRLDMTCFLEHKLLEYEVAFDVDDPEFPSLLREEDACAFPDEGRIVLTPSTYDGLCEEDPRARFTVAHEFGHILLHGSNIQGLSRGLDPNRPHKAYCDSEWQADTLAAELLMPADQVMGLDEYEIMDRFGVSYAAARIRRRVLSEKR